MSYRPPCWGWRPPQPRSQTPAVVKILSRFGGTIQELCPPGPKMLGTPPPGLRREQRFPDDFLDRRMAIEDPQQAGLAQRPHALLPGHHAQLLRRRALHDELLD